MTTSAYMPDVKVEIAFNAGYSTPIGSRTWTDVSAYVELSAGISITRGRGDEFGTTEPNKLSLTLDNTDGRFTAGKATGAYYPNVKIGRPIRVTSTPVGGAASVRFLGYVDEWPVEWNGTDDYASADITASSRMARLGFNAELQSMVYEEILADRPIAYYPMTDGSESTTAGNVAVTPQPSLTQTGSGAAVEWGSTLGADPVSHPAATFAAGKYLSAVIPYGATDITIECFASFTASLNAVILGVGLTNLDDDAGRIQFDATGKVVYGIFGIYGTTALAYNDGLVHHFALKGTTAGAGGGFYIDGVLIAAITEAIVSGSGSFIVGDSTSVGQVSHVAMYDTALSAARILAHAQAGLTAFNGDTATARIARYATYAGIPSAEFAGDSDTHAVSGVDISGKNALEAMRSIEDTEAGVLFDARDNTLTFKSRASRYNITAGVTLDAAAHEVEAGLTPKLDRSALVNDVTATAADGSTARAVNQTSVDDYGYARQTLEVVSSNDDAFQAANWLVNTHAEPAPRVPNLSISMLSALMTMARQTAVFTLDVGSKIAVTGMPAQASASSISFYVEGYTESIGMERYSFTFNVSPTTGYDVWTVEDAVYGQYDAYPIAL